MKRCFLLLSCVLLACCAGERGGRGTGGKQDSDTPLITDEPQPELSAPVIKVYVENSGSMDGYVKGVTGFENAVYSYLAKIQGADLGVIPDSLPSDKNIMILNYINSKVIEQDANIQAFIQALEPADFRKKGGDRGTSDISEVLRTIVKQTGDNDVSVFVSDCIFSPGKKYAKEDDAIEYLIAQKIGVTTTFYDKLREDKDFSVVVMRLTSNFNGNYYDRLNNSHAYNGSRPYYMWLMGSREQIANLLSVVNVEEINEFKNRGLEIFIASNNSIDGVEYAVLTNGKGQGKFRRVNDHAISDVEAAKNRAAGRGGCSGGSEYVFKLPIGVDFSGLLLPESYLLNPDNYEVSSSSYRVEIEKNAPGSKYSHTLMLISENKIIPQGEVSVTLNNVVPNWFNNYSVTEDTVVIDPEKTFGLSYLMNGVIEAYSTKKIGTLTIKIQ